MSKKIIARTAKLLSEQGKINRRYKGVAISYEHIPKDLEERNHGSIFAVININTENEEAKEVAELIIEALHGEFYLNLKESPLTSFEAALAKINEELGDITHQGKIGWMGNLHAVLAVLENNKIHLTKAGKTEAYLYRGEKTSNITHDLAGDSINPLRTFINIASGELLEGDKISITTPGVFFHISKDELKRYVTGFQPKVAISHIADLLEGTAQNMQPNAVLIIEGITPEAASSETLSDQPDEVWVAPPTKHIENAVDTAKPFVLKMIQLLAIGWASFTAFISDQAIPFIKNIPNQTKNTYQGIKKKSKDRQSVLAHTQESLSDFKEEEIDIAPHENNNDPLVIVPQKSTRTNEIFIKEAHVKPRRIKLERFDFTFAKAVADRAKGFINSKGKNKKQLLYLGIAVFLILFISITLTIHNRNVAKDLTLAKSSLTEAQSKYDIAKNALDNGDRKLASENLTSAQSIVNSLTKNKNKQIKSDAEGMAVNITKLLDQAQNIIRPGSTLLGNATEIVGENTLGPYLVGSNLFVINKDNGSIAAINTGNNEVSNVLDKPSISGKFIAGSAITARNVLILVTDNGSFYEFDTKENNLNKQAIAGDIEKVRGISAFSTNIYTLGDDGKIYKRVKTTGGYGKRSDYITDGSTANGGVDLAIDSNIFVLGNSEITKFLAGKKQNYQLSNLPFSFENPKTVFANEDVKGQFVVDSKNRLIRFDDNGNYLSQYTEGNFEGISGVSIDSKNNVYFTAKGKVYKFAL